MPRDPRFDILFEPIKLGPVTRREPDDTLWNDLQAVPLQTLTRIGDCEAPGILVHAIYDAQRAAREFGLAPSEIVSRRERPLVLDV